MKKTNLRDVSEAEQHSPNKKYHLFRRHISVALGARRDVGPWAGGHPFDIEYTRIPTGASNFPLHQHAAQWESYIFVRGSGEITDGTETVPVQPDDVTFYPETQKWGIKPQRKYFEMKEGDYFEPGD